MWSIAAPNLGARTAPTIEEAVARIPICHLATPNCPMRLDARTAAITSGNVDAPIRPAMIELRVTWVRIDQDATRVGAKATFYAGGRKETR